jgi:hypothetical protein
MKTYTIELNELLLNTLKSFLENSEIKGYDVPKFIELAKCINSAKLIDNSKVAQTTIKQDAGDL